MNAEIGTFHPTARAKQMKRAVTIETETETARFFKRQTKNEHKLRANDCYLSLRWVVLNAAIESDLRVYKFAGMSRYCV